MRLRAVGPASATDDRLLAPRPLSTAPYARLVTRSRVLGRRPASTRGDARRMVGPGPGGVSGSPDRECHPCPQPAPADHRLDSVPFAVWVPEPHPACDQLVRAGRDRWHVRVGGVAAGINYPPTDRSTAERRNLFARIWRPGGRCRRSRAVRGRRRAHPARVGPRSSWPTRPCIPNLRAAAARRQRALNVETDNRSQTLLDHRGAVRRELGLTDTRTLRIRPDGHVHGALTVLRTESSDTHRAGDTDTQGQTILPPQGGPRGAARPLWRNRDAAPCGGGWTQGARGPPRSASAATLSPLTSARHGR
jgi:hypothetical protein